MKRRDVETAWVRPVGRLPQMALPSLRPPPDGSGYCGKGTAEKAECNIAGRRGGRPISRLVQLLSGGSDQGAGLA